MPDPMDTEEIRAWLDREWRSVLDEDPRDPDPEVDGFVNSAVVSIRYAFVTQLLGKVADHDRGLLALQKGASDESGAWDARSFAKHVVVPWVADNHDVLGTSAEPYVSKPLRRPRLVREMPAVRNKSEWRDLHDFLSPLDGAGPERIRREFRRCLRSLARKLERQSFKYRIPARVGMADVERVLGAFLGEASQGLRPLAVAVALMRTLGVAFSLFSRVESQGLNEADAASGVPGDIVCFDREDRIVLAVEVKEHDLAIADLRASIVKVREARDRLSNLMFAVPGIRERDRDEIETRVRAAWASGLDICRIDIETLARATLALLDEEWRPRFLANIGTELDTRGEHRHRAEWHRLLSALGETA